MEEFDKACFMQIRLCGTSSDSDGSPMRLSALPVLHTIHGLHRYKGWRAFSQLGGW